MYFMIFDKNSEIVLILQCVFGKRNKNLYLYRDSINKKCVS